MYEIVKLDMPPYAVVDEVSPRPEGLPPNRAMVLLVRSNRISH